jgi:predicted DNA-binding transcriptional regulator AlpA
MTHHLVGVTEIAQMLDVSRQRVTQLHRMPGFPEPVVILASGRVWERERIEEWARLTGRTIRAD